MNAPQQYKQGDSWVYAWPDLDRRIVIDKVKEHSSGDISADVWVKTVNELPQTGRYGHVYMARISNLAGTRAKSDWAAAVAKRSPLTNGYDWNAMLEIAAIKTMEGFNAPEPIVDLSEVDVPTKRDYLLQWFLPTNEPTHFFANSEGGKSLFADILAVAMSSDLELPHHLKPTRKCNVLYIDYETHRVEMARRMQWIARGFGVKCPRIKYLRPYRPLVAEIGNIRKLVQEHSIDFVVVDSVTFCTDKKLVDVESASEVYAALDSLKVTVLTIGHMTKADSQGDGKGSAFGSMAWRAKARNSWEIRSVEAENGDKLMSFWHDKDNNGAKCKKPMGFRIAFHETEQKITVHFLDVEAEPELVKHGSNPMKIRAALKANGDMTIKDIAEETGLALDVVRVTLKRMPDAVEVTVGARGRGNAGTWGLKMQDRQDNRTVPF